MIPSINVRRDGMDLVEVGSDAVAVPSHGLLADEAGVQGKLFEDGPTRAVVEI